MATGIVALAAHLHSVALVPTVLFWLNALFFVGLATATAVRSWRYPGAFAADLRSHSRGVGFFTMVAASGVFGSQLVLQMGAIGPARSEEHTSELQSLMRISNAASCLKKK